jgi:hypothetical protein
MWRRRRTKRWLGATVVHRAWIGREGESAKDILAARAAAIFSREEERLIASLLSVSRLTNIFDTQPHGSGRLFLSRVRVGDASDSACRLQKGAFGQ